MSSNNPLIPFSATITKITDETKGDRAIKSFTLELDEKERIKDFIPLPGQCAIVGKLGIGEAMFSITSYSTEPHYLQFSILRTGKLTESLHNSEVGDKLTVRGPYGTGFPVDDWIGKNIITIGGGIGQAPLRPIIHHVIKNRDKYGKLTIIYGSRTSQDLCFKDEYDFLASQKNTDVRLSIDNPEDGWKHFVGFVPTNLMEIKPSPQNAIAITCGPPIMIKFVLQNLKKLGFTDDQIFTTLERRMKCGIGKCGRCNINHLYVCKDGPVFSYAQLKTIPEVIE